MTTPTTKLPPGIRHRGTKFQVDVSHAGARRTATCDTLEEATTAQARLKLELLEGASAGTAPSVSGKATVWRLESAYRRTWETRWRDSKSARTVERLGKAAMTYFGRDLPLDKITTDEIDKWVGTLEEAGSSNATINRKLACLSRMMRTAHERGGLAALPHFPRKRESQGRLRWLSEAEEEKLLTATRHLGSGWAADVWIVLVDTGLRVGELLALEARDVDLKRKTLTVWVNKTDNPRTIPTTVRVRAILKPLVEKAPSPTGKLFDYGYGTLRQVWDRVRGHLGMTDDPQFIMHTLRHTCASRLAQKGVPLQVIKEWMGHKSLQVTLRYAHLAPKNLLDAVGVLEPQPMRVAAE